MKPNGEGITLENAQERTTACDSIKSMQDLIGEGPMHAELGKIALIIKDTTSDSCDVLDGSQAKIIRDCLKAAARDNSDSALGKWAKQMQESYKKALTDGNGNKS